MIAHLIRFAIIFATMLVIIVFGILSLPVAADDVPNCPAIGKAAGYTIYRCIDEDEGNIIYMNELGFMFPLEW